VREPDISRTSCPRIRRPALRPAGGPSRDQILGATRWASSATGPVSPAYLSPGRGPLARPAGLLAWTTSWPGTGSFCLPAYVS